MLIEKEFRVSFGEKDFVCPIDNVKLNECTDAKEYARNFLGNDLWGSILAGQVNEPPPSNEDIEEMFRIKYKCDILENLTEFGEACVDDDSDVEPLAN